MRINQVLIVPAFYPGKGYGRFHGMSSEYDGMMAYLAPLCERIEDDNITHDIHQEGEVISPNTLVIHASIGWFKENDKAVKNNKSVIKHGKNSGALADLFNETIVDWGKTYVDFEHTSADPKPDNTNPYLRHENTMGVSIAPFMVNSLNVEEYLKWAPTLGAMLGLVLVDYVKANQQAPINQNFGRASV